MKYAIITEETVYSGIFKIMFNDIINYNNSEVISKYLSEDNKIRKYLFDFLYKNKVNRILKGSFECILKPKYSLEEFLQKNNDEECVVLFMNGSLQKFYNEKNLKKIKDKYKNVKYVLLFVDAIFQKQAERAFKIMKSNVFDLVYTFDELDAKNYNLLYINTPYSKIQSLSHESKINGVYFCGSEKGRGQVLNEIAIRLNKLNIPYKFDVYGKVKDEKEYNFKLKMDEHKPYINILEDTLEYSCILDIVQNGREEDTGLSLRVYEATVYNKILITNNRNIFKYELYDSRYMHYIENANEIKKEWFLEKPNYSYNGELSPKIFIKDIEKRIKGKVR